MPLIRRELPRAEAAHAGNPDGRVRLLNRPRPQVHHRQLRVLPVVGERLARLPRLQDQVVRLVVALALLDRRDAVAHVGVHRRAQRHPRHQPPARDAVQHRVLLRDPDRRVRRRERRAHLHQRHVLAAGRARQRPAHHVRAGHEAVGVLVVLVYADTVEAEVGCVHQLVERPVVVVADPLRCCQLVERRVDPDRVIALLEVVRQLPVGHQVEHRDFHRGPPSRGPLHVHPAEPGNDGMAREARRPR